jgi:Holliday junction resolvase
MVKNKGAKGARGERERKKIREAEGYTVTRSGGSLGPFDLVGVRKDGGFLEQVKNGYKITASEKEALEHFDNYPKGVFKKFVSWRLPRESWNVEEIK